MVRKKTLRKRFYFVVVRISTISYLCLWIGLWTLNLLRFSVIYLVCTGFLPPHKNSVFAVFHVTGGGTKDKTS